MDQDQSNQEARLRRLAKRHGLALRKSRTREPQAFAYGRFLIVDPMRNWIVAKGPSCCEWMTLEEVEDFLTS